MIINWNEVKLAKARWHGSHDHFRQAVAALDAALTRHDVSAALKPPIFKIEARPQPQIERNLYANFAYMLAYGLTEHAHSTEVRVVL